MEAAGFKEVLHLFGPQDTLWKLWERRTQKGFFATVAYIISLQDIETWNKGPARGLPVRLSATTVALIGNPNLTDNERIGLLRDLYESVQGVAKRDRIEYIDMPRKGIAS